VGIAYGHDAPSDLGVSVEDGEITAEHRRWHMALLASDPAWATGRLLLTDLRSVCPSSTPSPERVVEAANAFLRRLATRCVHHKWAVVANHTFEQAPQVRWPPRSGRRPSDRVRHIAERVSRAGHRTARRSDDRRVLAPSDPIGRRLARHNRPDQTRFETGG
jgi:hypothetical protein